MKNANGEGSVVKVAGTRRKAFAVRITLGIDRKGRQRRQYIGYYKTLAEAQNALSDYRRAPTTKLKITLSQLYTEWSAKHFTQITEATRNTYRAAWIRLKPLENHIVKEIRTGQLQAMIDSAYAGSEGVPPLGQSSLSKIKALCTCLWNYALENDIVNKNYADFIVLPKIEKAEKERFSDLNIKTMWKAYKDKSVPNVDVLLIMCYTGFRITELLELTSFSYDSAAQTFTGGIKTDAGKNRVVPIFGEIQSLVSARVAQNGTRIICKDDGTAYNVKYFREKIYYPILEKLSLPKLTPHATRHTTASLLVASGADPVYIQKILGHANYQTTVNTYTHVNIDELTHAMGKIKKLS